MQIIKTVQYPKQSHMMRCDFPTSFPSRNTPMHPPWKIFRRDVSSMHSDPANPA